MPCLRCDSIIPTGTGRQLTNGLMCRECLPDNKLHFMTQVACTNIGNWAYIKDIIPNDGHMYRNILTDTISQEQYGAFRGYYLYPMMQTEYRQAHRLDRSEYLLLNPGCKLYETTLTNCTLITNESVELINSHVSSLYLSGTRPKLRIDNTYVGFVRGLNMPNRHIELIIANDGKLPNDMSEVDVSALTIVNCQNTNYSIHNVAPGCEVAISDSSIPILHICNNAVSLTLNGSTINEYDTEGIPTPILNALYSHINVYESVFVVCNLIESVVTLIPCISCPVCLRPVRTGSLSIKGSKVHENCMRRRNYSYDNYKTIGNSTKLPPFGFELELHHNSSYEVHEDYEGVILDLILHGFKRTSDSSVTDEMKSPILRSDKWVLDIGATLNKVAKEYIDDRCGTHIHVSCDREMLSFLRNHRGVFEAISEYMDEHSDSTEQIWGRFFNHNYAQMYVDPNERTSWINITGNHRTIEYRLPQLQSIKQFQRLIWFTRMLTVKLDHIADDYSSSRQRYTYKMERDVLTFYQKFEALTLRGGK